MPPFLALRGELCFDSPLQTLKVQLRSPVGFFAMLFDGCRRIDIMRIVR